MAAAADQILAEFRLSREKRTGPSDTSDVASFMRDTFTCEALEAHFGADCVHRLTRLLPSQLDFIMDTCKGTLQPTGPGRRYRDLRARTIVYLTWLESGSTISKLSTLFGLSLGATQRTIDYIMTTLTDPFSAALIPRTREDVPKAKGSVTKHPEVLGAVDATLFEIAKPRDRALNQKYFSGKHWRHGLKLQAVVSADGQAVYISPLFPGHRHDASIFRKSGLFVSRMELGAKCSSAHPCWETVAILVLVIYTRN